MTHRAVREPVLGTTLDLAVTATDIRTARRVERVVVAEIARLEAMFSAFQPESPFARWRRGESDDTTLDPELVEVLTLSLTWQRAGRGLYNPLVGRISDLWSESVRTGIAPSPEQRRIICAQIIEPPYTVEGGRVHRTGDCSALSLHALAKGWIVDRALDAAVAGFDTADVLVNAGGDLAHRGTHGVEVRIEDPSDTARNAEAIARVRVRNQALATSGSSHRGFAVAGQRYSHVIDPRTGDPVEATASASVITTDAATADILATIASVASPDESIPLIESLRPTAAVLVVERSGHQHANAAWTAATRQDRS